MMIFQTYLIWSLFYDFTTLADCPEGCSDYYGRCRKTDEAWIDDETWQYICTKNQSQFTGCVSNNKTNGKLIKPNTNVTVDGFWFSCTESDKKLKYEQEPSCILNSSIILHVDDIYKDGVFQKVCKSAGLWILGCFYKDEKGNEHVLSVGNSTFVGLIRHNCKEISSNPGRIQYWTSLNSNVTIASPSDRGRNENLPQNVTNLLKYEPKSWTVFNAEYFIKSNSYDVKIRNLIFQ